VSCTNPEPVLIQLGAGSGYLLARSNGPSIVSGGLGSSMVSPGFRASDCSVFSIVELWGGDGGMGKICGLCGRSLVVGEKNFEKIAFCRFLGSDQHKAFVGSDLETAIRESRPFSKAPQDGWK